MGQDEIIRIFLMIVTTFLFVVCLVPFIKNIAIHVGALDIPNERKVHSKPMPRLGGLAIFFGFLFGYMLFGEPSSTMNSILIGSFIIVLTGAIDDIKPLKASVKFAAQVMAAMVVSCYGKLLIQDITAFGLYIDFGIFAYPITIFFILGCLNCINLIDGLDGLAAGISAIYFATIGIISVNWGLVGILDFNLVSFLFGSASMLTRIIYILVGIAGLINIGLLFIDLEK